jgi:hypothetical protein
VSDTTTQGGLVGVVRRFARVMTPHGWRDLAFQVGIFVALGALYALSGPWGRAHAEDAIYNAGTVFDFESANGLDWEPGLQAWVLDGHPLLRALGDHTYFLCQFSISNALLLWIYARRSASFPLVRDALVGANIVAFVVSIAYPVAPPRLVPDVGMVDTMGANDVNMQSGLVQALNNPYAAMPSLHASYAVVLGIAGVMLTRRWWARALWAIYPFVVFYSIIATANHFVLDAAVGVLALAVTPLVVLTRQSGERWRSGRRPVLVADPRIAALELNRRDL